MLTCFSEGSEGKGVSLGTHCVMILAGGQMKVQEKKEAAKRVKVLHGVTLSMFLFHSFCPLGLLKLSFRSQLW